MIFGKAIFRFCFLWLDHSDSISFIPFFCSAQFSVISLLFRHAGQNCCETGSFFLLRQSLSIFDGYASYYRCQLCCLFGSRRYLHADVTLSLGHSVCVCLKRAQFSCIATTRHELSVSCRPALPQDFRRLATPTKQK